MIIIANPVADSAAATVKINNENNWPYKSSKYNENVTKFKLMLNNTISIHINVTRICRRFKIIPKRPIKNKNKFTVLCIKSIKYF